MMMSYKSLKKSDLPPVIPAGGPTQLVRVRKWGGKVYQDCDVWIGDEIRNSSWTFDKSVWANPFPAPSTKKSRDWFMRKYKSHILSDPKLRKELQELRGKRLGCMCSNDLKRCHGWALMELIEETKPFVITNNKYFFKGQDSPLSNLYPFAFLFNGMKFNSVYQAFVWHKADKWNVDPSVKKEMMREILETSTPMETYRLVTNYHDFREDYPWSREYSVCFIYQLLSHKWRQCTPFRKIAMKYSDFFISEATKNTFFGCGMDLHAEREEDICNRSIYSLPGKNILGWLIKYITLKNAGNEGVLYQSCDSEEEKSAADDGLSFIIHDCFPKFLEENRPEKGAKLHQDVVVLRPDLFS